jgi:hypothetical protein
MCHLSIKRHQTNKLVFLLGLISSAILIYSCSTKSNQINGPQPETYLIPENFEGRFRIIYGETCGYEPKIEKGRRILEIPNSRLLVIKPKFVEGITDYEFFFVDNKGRRTKIVELDSIEQRVTIRPAIILNMMNGTTAVMTGPMPDGTSSSESPLAIHYTDFTVFNKDTTVLDVMSELRAELKMAVLKIPTLDDMMHDLVEDCRKKNGR